jgi:GNAT superfamily N-acetyltransferase
MADHDFDDWSARSVRGFAAQQVAAGVRPEPEATAYARRQLAALLPRRVGSPGHYLWTLHEGPGAPVGHAWLQLREHSAAVEGYLLDIEIAAPHRRRGLGRAAMLAIEEEARGRGAAAMGLNVFGHNRPARALYTGLGYTVAEATLAHTLSARSPTPDDLEVALLDMDESDYAALRPSLAEQHGAALDRLLPFGPATSGHRLWTACAGHVAVGTAWLEVQHPTHVAGGEARRDPGPHALVRHLEVDGGRSSDHRGPAVLAAVLRAARELGVTTLTVSLSGSASSARALFDECGFAVVAETMTKPL